MSRKKNKKRGKRSRSKSRPRSASSRPPYVRLIWPALAGGACVLAIFFLFRAIGPESRLPTRANADDPAQVAAGELLYARHCASCHGPELEGQPEWKKRLPDGRFPAPPHDQTGHTSHHSDEMLFRATKYGREPTARGWAMSGMPLFGETLTDSEIWAVIEFIKSRWPPEMQERQARLNR